ERRIVLLGPGSRDLRLARLREVRGDLQVLALVPLFDQHQPTGVLVLAAPDGRLLSEEILPCLSSVFALLGLLVGGRRIGLAVADVPDRSDSEHLEVRLEESRARNVEAEDSLRRAQEAASSSDAAGRADLAAARARIAELEARVATLQGEAQTRSDDAGNYTALAIEASIGAMRIEELEEEIVRLDEALRGGTLVTTDLAQGDAVSEVTAPLAIEEDGAEEVELGAIAEAAAAALETLPGTHASDADTRERDRHTDARAPPRATNTARDLATTPPLRGCHCTQPRAKPRAAACRAPWTNTAPVLPPAADSGHTRTAAPSRSTRVSTQ
ncbi:MAG: hypothetical protein ABGW95_03995, partial [Candidatus Poseidoniia archaeon]